jgi:hypothetical protein
VSLTDPYRDPARVRRVTDWPRRPWLPVTRWIGDQEQQHGFIYEEDVTDGESLRLFGTTDQAQSALIGGELIDWKQLPILDEFDSIEDMFATGWVVAH